MKKFSEQELKDILDKHGQWLRGEEFGEQANLSGSNLSGSNLRDSNLRGSNLSDTNLRGSDLSGSDLRGSDLSGSDLSDSNLIIFQFERHVAYFTGSDNMIRIGCNYMTIDKWIECFESIGQANNYSKNQIKMYGEFIKMCKNVGELK